MLKIKYLQLRAFESASQFRIAHNVARSDYLHFARTLERTFSIGCGLIARTTFAG